MVSLPTPPHTNAYDSITHIIYYSILTSCEKNFVIAFDPEQALMLRFEQKILKYFKIIRSSLLLTIITFSISKTFLRMLKNESHVFNDS